MSHRHSGILPLKWSLFVDTDSLYLQIRKMFSSAARMDYLRLPFHLSQNTVGVEYFEEKMALVMRMGKEWPSFSESLMRFGYEVVPADRGMQPITIGTKVMSLMHKSTGIVFITGSDKILPLIHQILDMQGNVKIATFDPILFNKYEDTLDNVDIILMDQSWLWEKHQETKQRSLTSL